jgi:hypothetical protein
VDGDRGRSVEAGGGEGDALEQRRGEEIWVCLPLRWWCGGQGGGSMLFMRQEARLSGALVLYALVQAGAVLGGGGQVSPPAEEDIRLRENEIRNLQSPPGWVP